MGLWRLLPCFDASLAHSLTRSLAHSPVCLHAHGLAAILIRAQDDHACRGGVGGEGVTHAYAYRGIRACELAGRAGARGQAGGQAGRRPGRPGVHLLG